jgi:hypothetical protein
LECRYNSEFEFLAERVSQRLELMVMLVPSVVDGRLTEQCVGRGHVWIDDLAQCPHSKVFAHDRHMHACHECESCVCM